MNHKDRGWETLLSEDEGSPSTELGELTKKWKVQEHQVWKLGRHKLYVGDSLPPKARITLGIKLLWADGVCTDPPYDLSGEQVCQIMSRYANKAVVMGSDAIVHAIT